ncbi:sigma-54 interaction domain-containing protein [Peribacillus cavernae]|uniref:sigma-54 interaction domain-containing protein n=1 Tax=Peribacillus cavernae TaxID=1674310 RepID=UPI001FEC6C5D|nr:sigma 54-interacting transcriptional regulator [Peribacillus cavernae]MDQ0217952.1 arginine utilization regulatory protein [Peribacillus cavernae]
MSAEQYNTREVLEAILTSIDEGIHVIDTKGTTVFYNQVAADNDGMEISEVLGRPLLETFPSLTRRSSTLLKVISSGKPITYKGQSYVNLHGKMVETMNTTLPIFVEGDLIGAVEIAKDVSRLRVLSERLLDLESSMTKQKKKPTNHNGAIYTFTDILTVSAQFLHIIEQGKKAADSSSSVLVFGESGVGKELFVQSIHNESSRRKGPFIAQNCAALPDSLLESLLFGTAKGSYTGAMDRQGLFELADGGTLFLDELQSMPIELQSKLLRVLEDGLVRRIGAMKSTSVDVRVIAAMNIYPEEALKENKLRADLFYRLNVMSYRLPSLQERKEDILLLSENFISTFNQNLGKAVKELDLKVKSAFLHYHWPGNVRELKHTIEYMMNVTEGTVLTENELPVFFNGFSGSKNWKDAPLLPLREAVKKTEEELIQQALIQTNGNVLQASKILEIPRQTLQYKIKKRGRLTGQLNERE